MLELENSSDSTRFLSLDGDMEGVPVNGVEVEFAPSWILFLFFLDNISLQLIAVALPTDAFGDVRCDYRTINAQSDLAHYRGGSTWLHVHRRFAEESTGKLVAVDVNSRGEWQFIICAFVVLMPFDVLGGNL